MAAKALGTWSLGQEARARSKLKAVLPDYLTEGLAGVFTVPHESGAGFELFQGLFPTLFEQREHRSALAPGTGRYVLVLARDSVRLVNCRFHRLLVPTDGVALRLAEQSHRQERTEVEPPCRLLAPATNFQSLSAVEVEGEGEADV